MIDPATVWICSGAQQSDDIDVISGCAPDATGPADMIEATADVTPVSGIAEDETTFASEGAQERRIGVLGVFPDANAVAEVVFSNGIQVELV